MLATLKNAVRIDAYKSTLIAEETCPLAAICKWACYA